LIFFLLCGKNNFLYRERPAMLKCKTNGLAVRKGVRSGPKGGNIPGVIPKWICRSIAKQAVSQLTRIPWGHNIAIIAKCKNIHEALYYVQNTMVYHWSRSVLVHQIESGLYGREGKAITNFPKEKKGTGKICRGDSPWSPVPIN
jgi:hypothetical protein